MQKKERKKEKECSKNESMNRALKGNIIKVRELKEELHKSKKLSKDSQSNVE